MASTSNHIADTARGLSTVPYELALAQDLDWAMSDTGLYFQEKGNVQDTLRHIAKRLGELAIPYAVVGGLALFAHGFRRFTEDVDILVTRESLGRILAELEGRGFTRPFSTSKNLRDATTGVRIEFLLTGGYPGDGKPQPVSFPDPSLVSVERNGIHFISLEKLIELKLASGMAPHRGRDWIDVQQMIETLNLPVDFAERLNPYVQAKFRELWSASRKSPVRFAILWRNEPATTLVQSIAQLVELYGGSHPELSAMQQSGVQLDVELSNEARGFFLFTTDSQIAARFDMHPEDQILM